jgi:DNA-binding beta-propeller fold protein YncE
VRTVAATLLLGAVLVLAACGGERHELRRPTVVAKIDTGQPVGLAAGFGSVWVADHREETVSRIDPQSNRVVRRIRLGVFPADLAAGAGGVWVPVLEGFRLARVDPRTNREVAAFRGVYTAATVGAGAAWALFYEGGTRNWGGEWRGHTVTRIDPADNRVAARIRLHRILHDNTITFGAGGVWVLAGQSAVRIDPATNEAMTRIRLPGEPVDLAVGEGAVWVSLADGRVARVDARRRRVTHVIRTGTHLEYIAVGAGAVWAGNVNDISNSTLTEIDPRTNKVAHTIPLCDVPQGLVIAYGDVWVGCFEDSQVWRVRP